MKRYKWPPPTARDYFFFFRLFVLFLVVLPIFLCSLLAAFVFVMKVVSETATREETEALRAAMVVTGSLAAACFSWSRALTADKPQHMARYCGERFLHAFLLLLLALVMNFAWKEYNTAEQVRWMVIGMYWLNLVLVGVAAMESLVACVIMHFLLILSSVVYELPPGCRTPICELPLAQAATSTALTSPAPTDNVTDVQAVQPTKSYETSAQK